MSTPLCPSCRESMSSVELGLGGVWSCLYCEGTWLSSAKARSLSSCSSNEGHLSQSVAEPPSNVAASGPLACHACESVLLDLALGQNAEVHRCPRCEGVFFKRGALQSLAPSSFSGAHEAPVLQALAGMFGSVLLGDPTAFLVALETKSARKNAL